MQAKQLDAAVWRSGEFGFELVAEAGNVLAFVEPRNRYCDRGHWRAHLNVSIPDLDGADEWPRYFMRSDRAMAEVVDFLKWRLCGVRAEETPATVLDVLLHGT